MSDLKVGEVSWDTADVPGEHNGERVSDFMVLDEGDNKGRVLSNPQQFYVHWVVDETGKKRKVNCAGDGCPVCARGQDGDKRQARWLITFLSRKDGSVKLLELSSQSFKGIKTLNSDPEWGSPADYDINVRRGKPGAQPLYTVIPGRRAPLTSEEKQGLVAFKERVQVARFIDPPTPADVAEKLGWSLSATSKPVSNDFRSSVSGSGGQAAKSKIDFDFDQ